MRTYISYQRLEPDTINGETLKVTQVYSSHDKSEIDKLEESLQKQIGNGLIGEISLDKEQEE